VTALTAKVAASSRNAQPAPTVKISRATRGSIPQTRMTARPTDERVAVTTARVSAAGLTASPSASTTRPANRILKFHSLSG